MHSRGSRGAVTCLVAGVLIVAVGGCSRPGAPAPRATDASSSSSSSSSTARTRTTTPAAAGRWTPFTAEAVDWTSWKPVMAGVRPATDADATALAARAETVLRRSFTLTAVGVLGEFELNWTPTHARVLFGVRGGTYLEAHSTPESTATPDREAVLRGPLTVCLHQEGECTRITGNEDSGDRPHLFDTMTDSLVYQASATMTAQAGVPELLDEVRGQGATAVTTVESPIGPLDCVVVVEDATGIAPLEGRPLEPGSSESDHTVLCLDARGLVVLSPTASFLPLTAYTSMRPEVPPGFDQLPFAVRPYS